VGMGEEAWGVLNLWPLCVLVCFPVVIVEGAYVRDCRGLVCVQLVQ
jgi:hypothetical protein